MVVFNLKVKKVHFLPLQEIFGDKNDTLHRHFGYFLGVADNGNFCNRVFSFQNTEAVSGSRGGVAFCPRADGVVDSVLCLQAGVCHQSC